MVYHLLIEIVQKIFLAVIYLLIIQSGHKFAHNTTAQLSWQVHNFDVIWISFFTEEYYKTLYKTPHEFFVTWSQIQAYSQQ